MRFIKNKLSFDKKNVENLAKNSKIIGVGETGLDFFYTNSDKNNQIDSFKVHFI